MHPTAAALLQDIQAGNYETALVLADWLDDCGHFNEARKLRARYKDHCRRCIRAEAWAADARKRLASGRVGHGTAMSWETYWAAGGAVIRQTSLLVRYVERVVSRLPA